MRGKDREDARAFPSGKWLASVSIIGGTAVPTLCSSRQHAVLFSDPRCVPRRAVAVSAVRPRRLGGETPSCSRGRVLMGVEGMVQYTRWR